MIDQRRQAERLPLSPPLTGRVGDMPVAIVEVSLIGCRLTHDQRLPINSTVKLRCDDPSFLVEAKVIRSELRAVHSYESGLSFTETPPAIRDLLGEKVEASPVPDLFARAPFLLDLDDDDDEPRPAPLPFLECRLTSEGWKRIAVESLIHPDCGFTMPRPAVDGDQEIDLYCRTFEVADDDTRRMIRLSFDIAGRG